PTAYFRFSYTKKNKLFKKQLKCHLNGKTKLFQFDYMDIKVINLNSDQSFSCKFDTEPLLDITCLFIIKSVNVTLCNMRHYLPISVHFAWILRITSILLHLIHRLNSEVKNKKKDFSSIQVLLN
ncbi:hypothetical protein BpHYR1_016092, partial [Brachionus plicatilis]